MALRLAWSTCRSARFRSMGGREGRRLFAAPRATVAALACALGAVALLGAGCGAEEHPNEPRPQPPTRVSVAISEGAITVQPPRIAIGPEPTQQIPQNQHAGQPRVQLRRAAQRRLRRRQPDRHRLAPRGARQRQGASAPSRSTRTPASPCSRSCRPASTSVSAADIPGAKPAKLVVGPYRTSSENDLLLP